VLPVSHHSRYTLALAYANSYHIGMSSLAFQRVFELVHRTPEWSCERFFTDGTEMPLSVEAATPLNSFGTIAFSISFEEDYVHLLQMLDRAGIARRRRDRGPGDPVIVVGGSCAMINPLTLSEFVDIFALGAAENLLPQLLPALAGEPSREAVLERLAGVDGFYVPAAFGPGEIPATKLKKLELSEEQMRLPGNLPTTAIVTSRTEFSDKFLIEMSRGCPEKCRYCWATFGMGRFRWHPTDAILASLERARPVTDQLGFIATAVGDHPEIELILRQAGELGFRSAVSSVRIPAVTEGLLEALHTSGGRSITLAPETGSDALRFKLNKPIPNSVLFDKVRLIFHQGFTGLKLYFIIGLPEETEEDVAAIVDVAERCRAIMLEELAPTGVIGQIHLGANILIPKPYTGYQRQHMERPDSLKRKISMLKRGVAGLDNVSVGTMSVRQATWQAYLSKADGTAAGPLEKAAQGASIASLLREFRDQIDREVFESPKGPLPWQFLRTA